MKPKYKRIMLKLSGEGLMGSNGFGIDSEIVERLAKEIVSLKEMGISICLVVGGGNFFRGAKNASKDMDRSVADQIGMMATVINSLAVKSSIEKLDKIILSLEEKGVQIIEKNVKIEKDSQNWLLTGEILVSEPVNNLIPNENGALE